MSLIPKKFLKYSTVEAFQADLRAGSISDKSIVFVTEEGKEFIYAQNTYFYGSFSADDAEELMSQAVQENCVVVTTLREVPTESTTTCMIDDKTYTFKVGDEVRVLDSSTGDSSTDYYVYYKLYNLKNGGKVAVWNNIGKGSGGMMGTINVDLAAYVNNAKTDGSELIGVQVTLTNTSDSELVETKTLTTGSTIVFDNVTPMKDYSISVTSINNYTVPAPQTITSLGIGATLTRTFTYKADQYTVNIVSNQGSDPSIADATVTYNSTAYRNGDTFKVVEGTSVSPTSSAMSNITGYAKSISTSNKTITATYSTTHIYLNMVSNSNGSEGPAPVGAKGTVKYSGGSDQVLSDNTSYAKVPTNTEFTVTYSAVSDYATPAVYSNTATGTSMTVDKAVYQSGTFTLNFVMSDNDPVDLAKASATVTVNSLNEQTLTPSNNSISGLKNGDVVKIKVNAVEGYTTPTVSDVTMQGGTGSATATYNTTIYHVSLTSNQSNDSTIKGTTVSLSYTYGGVVTKKTSLGGNGTTSDVKVPSTGVTSGPTVEPTNVTGYSHSINNVGQNFTVAYTTELLTVTLTSDTGGATLSDATITVTNTANSTTLTTAKGSLSNFKIASGTSYKVSVSNDVKGFAAPADVTYTAASTSGASRTVTMTYTEQSGFVDLGLKSGLKWAECNIGAEKPEDYGYYFSWGNIDGHKKGEGHDFSSSAYNSTKGKNVSTNLAVSAEYDIARAVMGEPWRLPTKDEFESLISETDNEWVSNYNGTGVSGFKFMKKSDHSVYIFMPAAGYYNGTSLDYEGSGGNYWSSTWYSSSSAYDLYFDNYGEVDTYYSNRYYGRVGRAVQ